MFKIEKQRFSHHCYTDKEFNGTAVNRAWNSMNRKSLPIMSAVL